MNDARLRDACRSGNLSNIKSIISSNHAFYMSDKYVDTYPHPLFLCSSRGHNECLEYILKALPCNIGILYESIGIAAMSNYSETVDVLFGFFKQPHDSEHPRLINALQYCIYKQKREMITKLMIEKKINHISLVIDCAFVGDHETLQLVMDKPSHHSIDNYVKYISKAIEIAINRRNFTIYNILSQLSPVEEQPCLSGEDLDEAPSLSSSDGEL